jgi:hypothetical protein
VTGAIALSLTVLDGELAITRLAPDAAVPSWATDAHPLMSVTRTAEELSIVAPARAIPAGVECEGPWRALAVRGPLDFGLVGILADLAGTLARAGVSLFAISTFDTDLVLVRDDALDAAIAALRSRGHSVIVGESSGPIGPAPSGTASGDMR